MKSPAKKCVVKDLSKDFDLIEMNIGRASIVASPHVKPPWKKSLSEIEIEDVQLITKCGRFGAHFSNSKDEKLYRIYLRRQKTTFTFEMALILVLTSLMLVIADILELFVYTQSFVIDSYSQCGIHAILLISSLFYTCYGYIGNVTNAKFSLVFWCFYILSTFVSVGFQIIHTPSDGIPQVLVLIYLTFICLPTYCALICCVAASVICIGHCSLVVWFWTRETNSIFLLGYQIGANILLCIGSCILGCIGNFYYDHKHRVSFLETKSSLIIKVNIEQGQLEQERLLLSILPKHVADEMIRHWGLLEAGQFRKIYMSRHEDVSILFADIVGFTAISSSCTAPELVKILNELFANFDRLSNTFRQARIKILGDCYYCVCGASEPRKDHAVLAVHMGLAMVDIIKDVAENKQKDVNMRVGIHTGAVLAGVLGLKQWQFDVLGKEVTIANRMESSGIPGRVHISHKTKNFLTDEFELEPGNGQDRDDVLRINHIVTYLVKGVLKPMKEDNTVRSGVTAERKTSSGSIDEVEFYKRLEDTLTSHCNEKKNLSQRQSVYMSIWSLWFKEPGVEELYRKSQEPLCGYRMVGFCCTLTSTFLAKICTLPRSLLVILVYIVGVTLLTVMTIFTWPQTNKSVSGIRKFGSWLNGSRITRISSSLLCVLILFAADTTGTLQCELNQAYNVSGKYLDPEGPHCHYPPYFVCSTCLVLLAVACILEFGYLIVFLLSMCISIFICITSNTVIHDLFDNYDRNVSPRNIPSKYYLCGVLFTVSVTILLISRYLERTYRRLFFWKYETMKQKKQVYELRRKNEALIYNILPAHVARDFIGRYRRDDELYSHSYNHIGVMFAACPNFHDFYNESSVNNNGLECLRFLNEIISDYDELLEQPMFSSVCKIKTVGPTYMAASGMTVNLNDENINAKEKWDHLDKLVKFAFLMIDTLKKINEQSFNNFILRIGINHGPIVAGVIGARKPHYDIWGNTVNVASRMESTGHVSKIQVVEETKNILEMFGYTFEKRGYVFVKGKGDLVTYFIKEPSPITTMPHQVI